VAEWRVDRAGTWHGLFRDEVCVGLIDDPAVADEIAAAMNRTVPEGDCEEGCTRHATCRPETARERSREDWACPAETWSWWHFTDQQVDAYWIRCTLTGRHEEHEDENTGLCWRTGERPAVVAEVHRLTEAETREAAGAFQRWHNRQGFASGCDTTTVGVEWTDRPADAERRSEATPQNVLDLSRTDPYDSTKGYPNG